MAKALAALYVAAVLALTAGAIGAWRLHCEGFGCMGVGVAWFAWAVAFLVVLALGLIARTKAAPLPGSARAVRLGWWFQLLIGAVIAATWLAKSAA